MNKWEDELYESEFGWHINAGGMKFGASTILKVD